MAGYELYVFILCFIVFTLLTVLFSYMISTITKMKLRMIRHGLEDEEITKEYPPKSRAGCMGSILTRVFSLAVCIAFCAAFGFSVYMNATEDKMANGVPSLKVVKSDSMAKKHENNTYLAENELDDQIQLFDIVVTRHLPPEEELALYDIVVYKQDETNIIHRIVGIEEPNEKHPEERHFLLQGDAVETPDWFPVRYRQMQGIYEGERIPFVGSFVMFLQSPAGWLCILLVLMATIVTPIVEKKLYYEINCRLQVIEMENNALQCDSEKENEEVLF